MSRFSLAMDHKSAERDRQNLKAQEVNVLGRSAKERRGYLQLYSAFSSLRRATVGWWLEDLEDLGCVAAPYKQPGNRASVGGRADSGSSRFPDRCQIAKGEKGQYC